MTCSWSIPRVRTSSTSIAPSTSSAAFDPRKAELVELCAFLGCGRGEAADLLGISLATAKRDFRMARAWLSHRLQHDIATDD